MRTCPSFGALSQLALALKVTQKRGAEKRGRWRHAYQSSRCKQRTEKSLLRGYTQLIKFCYIYSTVLLFIMRENCVSPEYSLEKRAG
jgi:hypothetical protein